MLIIFFEKKKVTNSVALWICGVTIKYFAMNTVSVQNAGKKRGKERGTDFSCYLAEDPQLNNNRINFVPISSYNQLSLKTIYILKVYIHNFTINLSLKKSH